MPLVTVTATDAAVFADVAIGGEPGSFQAAPKFPLTLAATRDLLNWSNAFPSEAVPTLSVDISATDTTIALTPGTGFILPLDTFEVSVDDEIIFVALRVGDSLTGCRRGVENSTSAIHFTGATIQLLVTALAHNQVISELIEVEQLLGVKGQHVFPTEIALAPGAPGTFTVAHGLGVIPRVVLIQMTSGGTIWFQSTRYDATNLYLVASDAGVTGVAEVWA